MVEESPFKADLNNTRNNAYRSYYDVSRHLVDYYLTKKGESILRKTSWFKEMIVEWNSLFCIKLFRPTLFCINDSASSKEKGREKISKFLNKKFPNKSSFEK